MKRSPAIIFIMVTKVTAIGGEQPLPPYGCCDLGPVILPRFIKYPFTNEARFDYDAFKEAIKTQVRFLDNVLDATHWPLEQQAKESAAKRRIGVGFTGLGNALTMLGYLYNSKEGLYTAEAIAKCMRDTAYRASIELAKEKGSFPLLNTDKYLEEGTFASRLPEDIKNDIYKYGIRNSHLLSIAPTGTVSLAFADNASNGIEPPFSLVYMRKKRLQHGGHQEYAVMDHSLRVFLNTLEDKEFANALLDSIIHKTETFTYKGTENNTKQILRNNGFITALELSVDEHLAMMGVVQPYIDSSISKCVVKGTRIITNKGILKVEDLGEAELPDTFAKPLDDLKVLCPDGNWRKVTSHYYGGERDTVKIRLNNGQTIEGSEVHKLMTINGWTQMSELRIGDLIKIRRDSIVNYEGGASIEGVDFYHNAKLYDIPDRMSEDLALFLGMMAADGHLQDVSGHVGLTKNDLKVGELFASLVKKLFNATVKHTIDPRNNVNSWHFNSRTISKWIKQLIGYRSFDKHVPEQIYAGSQQEMKMFLAGLSLDGYSVTSGGENTTCVYCGRSKELADGAFSLLKALGYAPRQGTKKIYGYDYVVHSISAKGIDFCVQGYKNSTDSISTEYVKIPTEVTSLDISSTTTPYYCRRNWLQRQLTVCKEDIFVQNFPEVEYEKDFYYVKITHIFNNKNEVYDIEVEESHDYLIDGVVSHNTVNVPAEYPFEDFKQIYAKAHELGLKGVATYRPNDILGSVLSEIKKEEPKVTVPVVKPITDNEEFEIFMNKVVHQLPNDEYIAHRKKISYLGPEGNDNLYLLLSIDQKVFERDGKRIIVERPVEVFIETNPDNVPSEWVDSLSRNLSLLARSGINMFTKALDNCKKAKSDKGRIRYGWIHKPDGTKAPRYHASQIDCIGFAIKEVLQKRNVINEAGKPYTLDQLFKLHKTPEEEKETSTWVVIDTEKTEVTETTNTSFGKVCKECGATAVVKRDGCDFCTNCGVQGSCG